MVYVKKTAFRYDAGKYETLTEETVKDLIWRYCEEEAVREHARLEKIRKEAEEKEGKPVKPPQVYVQLVNNAALAVRSRCRLPDATLPNTWLIDQPLFTGPPLAVSNGILDLSSRKLCLHTPDYFALTRLPVAFDAAAPQPAKFLSLLSELSCGDPQWVAVMQEVFGACLDSGLAWKHFTALTGESDTGKTVVLSVLRTLLGTGNYSAESLAQITTNRFGTFPLFGKLANIMGDENTFDRANEGKLKALTGGDAVSFEEKHKTPFFGPNTAKVVFGCNTVPEFEDQSEGVWNRLLILPLKKVIPKERQRPEMLTAGFWADELPGILNWSLDGLDRYRSNRGVTEAKAVVRAVKSHRADSDPARRFLTENYYDPGDGEPMVSSEGPYAHYRNWFGKHGYDEKKYLLNSIAFGKRVRSVFKGAYAKAVRSGKRVVWTWIGFTTRMPRVGVETDDEQAAAM
ncbi:MAG TPA: phage/plasmid primase, P4 family [Gemmataceae bacterium]|nr:phage/plasmid primase, P4 family [Gemmataceae bacterium]